MPILVKEDMQRALPELIRIRQKFDAAHIEDIPGSVKRELERPEIKGMIKPGARVAVAVGSRGIRNLLTIVGTLVEGLKKLGASPFIVSAMGSHGGGTEEGQRAVLASYGVTEENLGVPVVTTVDTVCLGRCRNGRPVWFDRAAAAADLIVPVNRVKLHTDFIGELQSGLCKMLVIGLGNHKGCSQVHEEPPETFPAVIEETASLIMEKAPVGFGLAILDNAYDDTRLIEAVPAACLIRREKELVRIAKQNMPGILLPEADVIVCREIGKDISGAGFDPNILGRSSLRDRYELPIPKYQRLVLTGLSAGTHGNGLGVGLFDVVTQNVVDELDLESMYTNGISCNALQDCMIPLTVPDEGTAIRVALKCCRGIDRENPRIIRIKNTSDLAYIEVSPALLADVRKNPALEPVQEAD